MRTTGVTTTRAPWRSSRIASWPQCRTTVTATVNPASGPAVAISTMVTSHLTPTMPWLTAVEIAVVGSDGAGRDLRHVEQVPAGRVPAFPQGHLGVEVGIGVQGANDRHLGAGNGGQAQRGEHSSRLGLQLLRKLPIRRHLGEQLGVPPDECLPRVAFDGPARAG